MTASSKKSRPLATVLVFMLLLFFASSARAQTVTLDQGWQFFADQSGTTLPENLSTQQWRPVRAGLSWNAQFPDLRDYMGTAWYRTRFEVPQFKEARRVLIRFGAVDYFCELFVNGKSIGTHEGGYTPFTFDVTDAVKPGANELTLRVVDPPMDEQVNRKRSPDMLYNEIPHGKQNWYVQTGGIWQPVTLEIKPKLFIEQVHITPHINGDFEIQVKLGGPIPAVVSGSSISLLTVTVSDPDGQKVFTKTENAYAPDVLTFKGKINSPKLWSTERPVLYSVEATLSRSVQDSLRERFGFRTFEARNRQLFLNGEPFYMIAALDQDFYPETIYTPPSEEFVRDQMRKGKRLGLNLLRCHIKVCDPVYLKVADEVGMLVWYEIPSWNDFNHFAPKAAERGEKTFAEMVGRDWNHPSIVIQSIINESWGADLKQLDQRRWLRAAFERAKRLTAPLGRVIVDNSACCDNFHVKTDIEDNHRYNSIPDYHVPFDQWVADFSAHPKWNFSPHGDAQRTGQEPLVLSEFGNWGLPKLPKELPWWFDRDFAGREVTRPAGLFDRFKQFQFGRLFKDYNTLAEETQWHQFASLKHEIEEIRSHATIQGYVITEFTDINWEVNGLMDMWRNPKVYAAELAKIQQPDVILARLRKQNYNVGERVEIPLMMSHYSHQELSGARVQWSTESGASGRFNINQQIKRASVEPLPAITFNAPQVNHPRRERLLLEVRGRDGSLIAENSYDLYLFPKPTPATDITIIFHTLHLTDVNDVYEPFMSALRKAGYNVMLSTDFPSLPKSKRVLISTTYDSEVQQYLDKGGQAIVLFGAYESSPDKLPPSVPFKITPRDGSDLDGNWVTNFNWIRSDAQPFSEVAFNKVSGFESEATIPRYVIQGVRGDDYQDVLSGIFYGWLNNNAALALQARAGNGKIFATTYRFDKYGVDPYTTRLLDAIIRYVSATGFAPKANWGTNSKG